MELYDVAIAGGGPAGLTAGLVLARSRRKVIVIDGGTPRNLKAQGIHGFISRDGINPQEFLNISKGELLGYGAEFKNDFVSEADLKEGIFSLSLNGGGSVYSKKLLIATGIKDNLPPLPGMDEMYGKSIFHCPYCDGWESRDKRIAVYAVGKPAYALSLSLKTWSDQVFIVSDGPHKINKEGTEVLEKAGINIYTSKISCLRGTEGYLNIIEFDNGESIDADILYFSAPQYQRSVLAENLGCKMSNKGFVLFGKNQSTNIKGLYVAGDAAHDMKFVVVAAAEGAKAAVAINIELQEEEIEKLKKISI